MVGGTDDVKNHPWFAPMNFDDLYNKRVIFIKDKAEKMSITNINSTLIPF
jgi:hypothetical protein